MKCEAFRAIDFLALVHSSPDKTVIDGVQAPVRWFTFPSSGLPQDDFRIASWKTGCSTWLLLSRCFFFGLASVDDSAMGLCRCSYVRCYCGPHSSASGYLSAFSTVYLLAYLRLAIVVSTIAKVIPHLMRHAAEVRLVEYEVIPIAVILAERAHARYIRADQTVGRRRATSTRECPAHTQQPYTKGA